MFRFELQPILEHREHLEQEEQRRVARIMQHILKIEDEIASVDRSADAAAVQWRHEAEGDLRPPRQAIFAVWREDLRQRRRALEAKLGQARIHLGRARQRLMLAHREVRKFELLRERALEEYRAHLATQERKFTEEMTVMRHRLRGGLR